MKRVYSIIAVFVLMLLLGKFVFFPSPTTVSFGALSELAHPTKTSSDPRQLGPSSRLDAASLPGEAESHEGDSGAEGPSKAHQILPGLVVSAKRVAIRAAASGTISELPVQEGDSVDAGQIVAHINDREIVAEIERQTARIASAESLVNQAQALVELAEYNHHLYQELSRKQLVARPAVVENGFRAKAEAAKLAALQKDVAVARHEKAVLEQRLAKYRTVAPFPGRVVEVLRYRDQYVGQGDVILWIESHEKQVKLHLPAKLIECGCALDRLQVSALVQEGEWLDLTVHSIKPNYNPDGSRTALFTIGPHGTLLSGQMVQIKVTLPGEKP